jgi:hypothetical protein
MVVRSAYEIARDDHPVIVIVGIKGGVEYAAVREAAVKDDGFNAHIAQQKIQIRRIESRQAAFGLDNQIGGLDPGHEFGPARSFDRMCLAIRNGANVERKSTPPCGADAVEIVGAATTQYRPDMDDGDT